MNQHSPKVKTYRQTVNSGGVAFNPFTGAPGVGEYGNTAETYHAYMLAFYDELPVTADPIKLQSEIFLTFTANRNKYIAMRKYEQTVTDVLFNPLNEMDYEDKTIRTGGETNTRTGSVADSGTDTTTNNATTTDSSVTYDNDTLRDVAQSSTTGGGSITHGKTTTYNSLSDVKTYNSDTATRTVKGHKTSPQKLLSEYTEFSRDNVLFKEIISDVVKAISCIVYVPEYPEESEE